MSVTTKRSAKVITGDRLAEAAMASGVSGDDFDAWVVPADMTHPA